MNIGGQALIEGVMMRSKEKVAYACRLPDGKIKAVVHPSRSWATRHWILGLPVIRGAVNLLDMTVVGLKALAWSAQQQDEEEIKGSDIAITMVLSLVAALVFFIGVPYFVAWIFASPESTGFHAIDGVARLLLFIAYLAAITLMSDVRRVFQYHGAEHKAVNCLDAKKRLTVKNAQSFPTEHPRCGTTFVVIVIVMSIVLFSFLRTPVWYWNILARIALIPFLAGISYELLKLGARFFRNPLAKALMLPGMWMQSLTTREPDDSMVEVAIYALKKVL